MCSRNIQNNILYYLILSEFSSILQTQWIFFFKAMVFLPHRLPNVQPVMLSQSKTKLTSERAPFKECGLLLSGFSLVPSCSHVLYLWFFHFKLSCFKPNPCVSFIAKKPPSGPFFLFSFFFPYWILKIEKYRIYFLKSEFAFRVFSVYLLRRTEPHMYYHLF